jgi:general secretion pathway protein D
LGYSVVPDGKNLKIVPSRDAANQARLAGRKSPGTGDEAVVRVIPVYYVSAIQLIPALRPLLPTWGNINAYPPSNSIIVSGSADNVERVADIIQEVDTETTNSIDLMVLKHAVADDIVKEVNQLILAARANGASTNATLSADPQSNSVLISGDAVSRLHLKVLIAKLDATGDGQDNAQVISLKYIQVKDILPVLKAMVHQPISISVTSGGGGSGGDYSGGGSSSGAAGSTNLGQASPQFNAAANNQINNAALNSGSGTNDDKNRVTVVGDVTNNDLIMTGSPSMMIQLRSIITKLDIPPQQVVVQGVIAQVDASTLEHLGIQWGTGGANQSNISGAGTLTSPYDYSSPGMGVGFLQIGQDMRALIQMLQSDANSNILSTPSVTAINNSPADIEVGQNVYDVSGQYNPTPGTPGQQTQPYITYTPKQIGLTLKVIPQITGDNSVRLVIYQENSAPIDNAQTAGGNVPTSEEKISTQVIVNNGQILVLGGLIDSQDRKVVTRVPILGYIPILGLLFQSHKTEKVKKDLMIFLRPIIITNPKTADAITQQRYNFMKDVAVLSRDGRTEMTAASILPKQDETLPAPFHESK